VMCFLHPVGSACGDEIDSTNWTANHSGVEQIYEHVPPISKINWSPDAKSLILVATDSSLWIIRPPGYAKARRLAGPIESLQRYDGRLTVNG
jgi:hypothetical protein